MSVVSRVSCRAEGFSKPDSDYNVCCVSKESVSRAEGFSKPDPDCDVCCVCKESVSSAEGFSKPDPDCDARVLRNPRHNLLRRSGFEKPSTQLIAMLGF